MAPSFWFRFWEHKIVMWGLYLCNQSPSIHTCSKVERGKVWIQCIPVSCWHYWSSKLCFQKYRCYQPGTQEHMLRIGCSLPINSGGFVLSRPYFSHSSVTSFNKHFLAWGIQSSKRFLPDFKELIMVWDKLTVIVYSDLGAETDSWLIQLMALKREGNIIHMWERPMILDKLS